MREADQQYISAFVYNDFKIITACINVTRNRTRYVQYLKIEIVEIYENIFKNILKKKVF